MRSNNGFSQTIFNHRWKWLFAMVLIFAAADQASKIWAQSTLAREVTQTNEVMVDGAATLVEKSIFVPIREIVVVPDAFSFIYKENPAAAFSLTHSWPDWLRRPLLILVSIIASIFFLIWYARLEEPDGILMTSFGLILAGAIGNFIDRVRLGYVIDFLDAYAGFLGYPYAHWPTFNVADSCIVVGAIFVFFKAFKSEKKVSMVS